MTRNMHPGSWWSFWYLHAKSQSLFTTAGGDQICGT